MKTLIAHLTATFEHTTHSLNRVQDAYSAACQEAPLLVAPLLKKIEQLRDLRNELQEMIHAAERTSAPHVNQSCRMFSADQLHAIESFRHEGTVYYATGKRGEDRATGQASAEFSSMVDSETGVRVWMRQDGHVAAD